MTQPLLSSSHLAENHRERDPAQAVWAEVSGAGNGVQKAVLQTRQGGAPRAVTGAVLPDHPAAHPELTRCLLQATAACPKNYSISAAVQPPEPSTFTHRSEAHSTAATQPAAVLPVVTERSHYKRSFLKLSARPKSAGLGSGAQIKGAVQGTGGGCSKTCSQGAPYSSWGYSGGFAHPAVPGKGCTWRMSYPRGWHKPLWFILATILRSTARGASTQTDRRRGINTDPHLPAFLSSLILLLLLESNILNNFSDKRGKIPPRKHKSQKIPRPAQAQENAARMRKMLQKLILQQSQPQQKAKKGSLPEADASPSLLIPAAFRRDNPIALLQQVTWHHQPHKQHTLVGSSCWLCRGFRAAEAFRGRVASPCSGCPEGGSSYTTPNALNARPTSVAGEECGGPSCNAKQGALHAQPSPAPWQQNSAHSFQRLKTIGISLGQLRPCFPGESKRSQQILISFLQLRVCGKGLLRCCSCGFADKTLKRLGKRQRKVCYQKRGCRTGDFWLRYLPDRVSLAVPWPAAHRRSRLSALESLSNPYYYRHSLGLGEEASDSRLLVVDRVSGWREWRRAARCTGGTEAMSKGTAEGGRYTGKPCRRLGEAACSLPPNPHLTALAQLLQWFLVLSSGPNGSNLAPSEPAVNPRILCQVDTSCYSSLQLQKRRQRSHVIYTRSQNTITDTHKANWLSYMEKQHLLNTQQTQTPKCAGSALTKESCDPRTPGRHNFEKSQRRSKFIPEVTSSPGDLLRPKLSYKNWAAQIHQKETEVLPMLLDLVYLGCQCPPPWMQSLLLHSQSKASLGDNRRQLWEAKVTGSSRFEAGDCPRHFLAQRVAVAMGTTALGDLALSSHPLHSCVMWTTGQLIPQVTPGSSKLKKVGKARNTKEEPNHVKLVHTEVSEGLQHRHQIHGKEQPADHADFPDLAGNSSALPASALTKCPSSAWRPHGSGCCCLHSPTSIGNCNVPMGFLGAVSQQCPAPQASLDKGLLLDTAASWAMQAAESTLCSQSYTRLSKHTLFPSGKPEEGQTKGFFTFQVCASHQAPGRQQHTLTCPSLHIEPANTPRGVLVLVSGHGQAAGGGLWLSTQRLGLPSAVRDSCVLPGGWERVSSPSVSVPEPEYVTGRECNLFPLVPPIRGWKYHGSGYVPFVGFVSSLRPLGSAGGSLWWSGRGQCGARLLLGGSHSALALEELQGDKAVTER
ncbi:hypothetical protein Anapl_00225 [Anas platyrhynchos]|uniref:Uncharacterized protein n=1 Tax=Anas platyrhynchos TaxID=8839 RepID=R0KCI3_ANAPL|nr:hypothetical protein Anapl_00225 [Anas platyrhynchos]